MKDKLDFETFASERRVKMFYPDPLTDTEEAWSIDILSGGLATFLWENKVYEGTIDEMEKKLYELSSKEPEEGELGKGQS